MSFLRNRRLLSTDKQGVTVEADPVALGQKAAANGIATLDGSTLVPTAQMGSGVADATKFLRGDRSWQSLVNVLGLTDLSDVAAKTGIGTTVVMSGSPVLTTPSIADFTNASHSHLNAAGGGTLSAAAITAGTLSSTRGGTGLDASGASNGQLLIGNGSGLTLAALIEGANITIVNGAGSITISAAAGGVTDHGALTGLSDDDHTIYALLLGRAGGQVIIGGTAASDNLTFTATSSATDGTIFFKTDPTTEIMRITSAGIIVNNPVADIDFSIFADTSGAATPSFFSDGQAGGQIGFGTNTPRAVLTKTFATNERSVHITSSLAAHLIISGGNASVYLVDTNGTVNERTIQINANADAFRIITLNDAHSALGFDFFSCDMNNGRIVVGAAAALPAHFAVNGLSDEVQLLAQGHSTQTSPILVVQDSASVNIFEVGLSGITMADAKDIIANTVTGTKIGTAITQKFGFWDAAPVVQPLHIADPSGGVTVDAEARTAINAINAMLASTGLTAAA